MMLRVGEMMRVARSQPATTLHALCGRGPIVVLAPHPDDESLGCGGLIAAATAAGIDVHVALLTDGSGSHIGSAEYPPPRLAALRLAELTDALRELGVPAGRITPFAWPDSAAPISGAAFEQAVRQLETLIAASSATCLFAPWREDPHCDHVAAALIAATAASRHLVRHLSYPIWGWTLPADREVSARTAFRLDITKQLAAKRRAVACHGSQRGLVVRDAQEAFTLPKELLDACLTENEIFFGHPA